MKGKKKFSIFTHWISELGDTRAKTHFVFNFIVILYGTFNLIFVYKTQWLFPTPLLSNLSFLLFGSYSFFLILLPLYPQDLNFTAHRRVCNLLYISILSGLIFLSYPLCVSGSSLIIKLILSITTVTGFLLGLSFVKMFRKYQKIPKNLVEIRGKEESFLIKNVCFFEWLFFLLVLCLQLLLIV
ncbi:DUF998 domain-containing protein [bacterium]|nr:DUF998 domain-containing protein [bacterium]